MYECNLWSLKKSAHLFQIASEKACDYLYKHLLKNTKKKILREKHELNFTWKIILSFI